MAAYTKTQDPNHLLTVGIEGFYGEYDSQIGANPGNGWASLTGQNFTDQHSSPSIDFGAIHYWPDRWTQGVSHLLESCLAQLLVLRLCQHQIGSAAFAHLIVNFASIIRAFLDAA